MGINKNLAIPKNLSTTKEHGLVIKDITTTDLGTFVCETSEPLQCYFAINWNVILVLFLAYIAHTFTYYFIQFYKFS